jgi:hypothetical protein
MQKQKDNIAFLEDDSSYSQSLRVHTADSFTLAYNQSRLDNPEMEMTYFVIYLVRSSS